MDCWRWNFDANDTELLVCRNDHGKGEGCNMQPMHPADVLALVNDLRSRVMNAEAERDAAVASERERWQRIVEAAQAVTTGCDDKVTYFRVPSHLMAALALALDERPNV